MTNSPTVSVVAADGSEAAIVAAADGSAIVAIGVPVVRIGGEPALAPGVPRSIDLGAGVELALDAALCRRRGFSGKESESLVVVPVASDAPALVFVGCGDEESLSTEALRIAAATVVRGSGRSGTAVFVLPDRLAEAAHRSDAGSAASSAHRRSGQAVAEGAVLAGYRYVTHKSEDPGGRVERVVVAGIGLDAGALVDGVRRGVAVAEAVCWARDLVNEPPSSMTPAILGRLAGDRLAGRRGVSLEVWDEEQIVAERLGGLLGVARGSAEPPRLLVARYVPPADVDRGAHVALVGKGITFDSGGLSLKTAGGMTTMKTDMSGAAAVLAAVSACDDLGVAVTVTAIAPVSENMPGGRATKPGDVLTIRNGKTIEVLNTDAEGRLVLADGLSLAVEMAPDVIVDLATLTGACVVALGDSIAGVLGNDESLIAELRGAADRAGEPIWPLPLPSRYASHIDSDVADMKNTGKAGQAGVISAALLLERFVADVPWAHLDIAGPARSDEDHGVVAKGGTGFGVRTLLELLERYGDVAGA